MATGRDLQIPYRLPGNGFSYPLKGDTKIFGRSLVGLDATGFAVPLGKDAVAFAGIAYEHADATNKADGGATVDVRRDVRGFKLAVSAADLNKPVYANDDETLTLDQSAGKFRIGVLVGIDDGHAWVNLSI